MPTLDRGRIVHVETPDPQGRNSKKRPAVVLTASADIERDGEVDLVAISGTATAAPREVQVNLPWQSQGNCSTKLTKPSVAVCTWLFTVPSAAIRPEDIGGFVKADKMAEILRILAHLSEPESPPGAKPPPPEQDCLP